MKKEENRSIFYKNKNNFYYFKNMIDFDIDIEKKFLYYINVLDDTKI